MKGKIKIGNLQVSILNCVKYRPTGVSCEMSAVTRRAQKSLNPRSFCYSAFIFDLVVEVSILIFVLAPNCLSFVRDAQYVFPNPRFLSAVLQSWYCGVTVKNAFF